MKNKLKNFNLFLSEFKLKNIKFENLDFNLFLIGVFLLASAPSIAATFLLISLLAIKFKKRNLQVESKYAKLFYLSALIFISSAIITSISFNLNYDSLYFKSELKDWNYLLNFIGLFNWIPFFIFFSGFEYFLKSSENRKKVSLSLLLGSFPVIVTVFGQQYFNWHGPLIFANGLIQWFQRPVTNGGATGLFNNENYAGAWLITIFPISIAFLKNINNKMTGKNFFFFTTFFIFLTIILTKSRNSLLGILILLPLMFSKIILYWYLPLIIVIFVLITSLIFPIYPLWISNIIRNNFPELFISKFNYIDINNLTNLPRISLWFTSLKLIAERPFFGWGAATFPLLYAQRNNSDILYGHSHNIFLEISNNYGLIAALSVLIPILIILKNSFKMIYLENKKNNCKFNIFERGWWTATICLLINQQFDIQYYDIRLSIIFWLLLAGLASSLNEKNKLNQKKCKIVNLS